MANCKMSFRDDALVENPSAPADVVLSRSKRKKERKRIKLLLLAQGLTMEPISSSEKESEMTEETEVKNPVSKASIPPSPHPSVIIEDSEPASDETMDLEDSQEVLKPKKPQTLAVEIPARTSTSKFLVELKGRILSKLINTAGMQVGKSARGIPSIIIEAMSPKGFLALKALFPEWKDPQDLLSNEEKMVVIAIDRSSIPSKLHFQSSLNDFGEVEHLSMMAGNNILAVFKEETSAKACLDARRIFVDSIAFQIRRKNVQLPLTCSAWLYQLPSFITAVSIRREMEGINAVHWKVHKFYKNGKPSVWVKAYFEEEEDRINATNQPFMISSKTYKWSFEKYCVLCGATDHVSQHCKATPAPTSVPQKISFGCQRPLPLAGSYSDVTSGKVDKVPRSIPSATPKVVKMNFGNKLLAVQIHSAPPSRAAPPAPSSHPDSGLLPMIEKVIQSLLPSLIQTITKQIALIMGKNSDDVPKDVAGSKKRRAQSGPNTQPMALSSSIFEFTSDQFVTTGLPSASFFRVESVPPPFSSEGSPAIKVGPDIFDPKN